jgi:hypothetical protein
MPPVDSPQENPANQGSVMLWDMAGTLIPYDPVTGRPLALPGCQDFLPELARHFRLVVTTGDGTASARGFLAGFEILPHLEQVFGDLTFPVGKPYGEILRQIGGDPDQSLAVGDRLRADIPADTDRVVTILINQDGDIINAGMVSFITHILRKQSLCFPEAFRLLAANAAPDSESVGSAWGGEITEAWRRNDGFDYRLLVYQHSALAGERLIIVI